MKSELLLTDLTVPKVLGVLVLAPVAIALLAVLSAAFLVGFLVSLAFTPHDE